MAFQQARGRRRPRPRPPIEPISLIGEVLPLPSELIDRLTLGGLVPRVVADAIVNAHYELEDGTKIFLFTKEKLYEVQEVIGVYDKFKEDVGNEADSKFLMYINQLQLVQGKKSRKGLFLDLHDSIYEAPFLAEYRRQESIKLALASRRRRPARGIGACGKCKSDEIYLEERFTRSGDEGGIITYVCGRCDNAWSKS